MRIVLTLDRARLPVPSLCAKLSTITMRNYSLNKMLIPIKLSLKQQQQIFTQLNSQFNMNEVFMQCCGLVKIMHNRGHQIFPLGIQAQNYTHKD